MSCSDAFCGNAWSELRAVGTTHATAGNVPARASSSTRVSGETTFFHPIE